MFFFDLCGWIDYAVTRSKLTLPVLIQLVSSLFFFAIVRTAKAPLPRTDHDMPNSCTFRSDDGADAFLERYSIVETAKKHNKTPFEAIFALIKGTDNFGVAAFAE